MRAVTASVGMLGIDCDTALSAADCHAMATLGVKFVGRYLGAVTGSELANLFEAGLLFLPIAGFARGAPWSVQTGQLDAQGTLATAKALGLPAGVHIFLDLEGEGMATDDAIAYATANAEGIAAAGFIPGLYAGAGCPLDGAALYALPHRLYWQAFTPGFTPEAGFAVIQLNPGDQVFAGLTVDFDIIQKDRFGRLPVCVSGA